MSTHKKFIDIKVVIDQLQAMNTRFERLLEQLPTSDASILAELDMLVNKQKHVMGLQTTKEKGSLFYEQASGKAMALRERYAALVNQGKLRKHI
jgi:DNA repair ATPase RecN